MYCCKQGMKFGVILGVMRVETAPSINLFMCVERPVPGNIGPRFPAGCRDGNH